MQYLGVFSGRRRYRDGKRYYEYDSMHGELEVYNSRGRHIGVVDVKTGVYIKPAVRGRRIYDV
jgi:hypothetical protein